VASTTTFIPVPTKKDGRIIGEFPAGVRLLGYGDR
jgi:hypothetical protein